MSWIYHVKESICPIFVGICHNGKGDISDARKTCWEGWRSYWIKGWKEQHQGKSISGVPSFMFMPQVNLQARSFGELPCNGSAEAP